MHQRWPLGGGPAYAGQDTATDPGAPAPSTFRRQTREASARVAQPALSPSETDYLYNASTLLPGDGRRVHPAYSLDGYNTPRSAHASLLDRPSSSDRCVEDVGRVRHWVSEQAQSAALGGDGPVRSVSEVGTDHDAENGGDCQSLQGHPRRQRHAMRPRCQGEVGPRSTCESVGEINPASRLEWQRRSRGCSDAISMAEGHGQALGQGIGYSPSDSGRRYLNPGPGDGVANCVASDHNHGAEWSAGRQALFDTIEQCKRQLMAGTDQDRRHTAEWVADQQFQPLIVQECLSGNQAGSVPMRGKGQPTGVSPSEQVQPYTERPSVSDRVAYTGIKGVPGEILPALTPTEVKREPGLQGMQEPRGVPLVPRNMPGDRVPDVGAAVAAPYLPATPIRLPGIALSRYNVGDDWWCFMEDFEDTMNGAGVSSDTKLAYLKSNVPEEARRTLFHHGVFVYADALNILAELYAPTQDSSTILQELQGIRQKEGERMRLLAGRIRGVVERYGLSVAASRPQLEHLVKDQFVRSVLDQRVRDKLSWDKGHLSIEAMVVQAQIFEDGNRVAQGSAPKAMRALETSSLPSAPCGVVPDATNPDLKAMAARLDALALEVKALSTKKNREGFTEMTCWNCGKKGHPQWRCPTDQLGDGLTFKDKNWGKSKKTFTQYKGGPTHDPSTVTPGAVRSAEVPLAGNG